MMTETKVMARRKPWVAGLLSGLLPGLGQLYNGQAIKAVLLVLFTNVVVCYFFIGLMTYGPFQPLYNLLLCLVLALSPYVSIIRDATCVARRLGNEYELRSFNKWYVYLGVVLVVALVGEFVSEPDLKDHIRRYVQAFKIPARSMVPTLLVGDHILTDNSIYKNGTTPGRGDIIVFKFPEDETKDFIKRIIGLPGDTIQIRDKIVYVNGTALDDRAYTQRIDPGVLDEKANPRDNFGPVTVPEESYFVLGDNRDQSLDSRFFGYVRLDKIRGKMLFIYWSWDKEASRVRWDRIGLSF